MSTERDGQEGIGTTVIDEIKLPKHFIVLLYNDDYTTMEFVIEILQKQDKAKVKGINLIKKHEKTTKEKKGGIISKENFIHISNLRSLDDDSAKKKGDKK